MTALEWRHVSYTIRLREVSKPVLVNQSGRLDPGDFLAILGPSGSGKTSLLNALAGRVRSSKGATLRGEVLAGSVPLTPSAARRLVSYVTQDEHLFAFLTVEETLVLSAKFHFPASTPEEAISTRVEDVLLELGLVSSRHSIVGSQSVRGISGGERKRVSIGKELMGSPSLVFVDEPTSGLDAFQAHSMIELLHSLTESGRVVVAVLHQPRSAIYELFDKILLLSEGNTMYFGQAASACEYFRRIGFHCPDHYNPADYFLDLISVDTRNEDARDNTSRRVERIAAIWDSSIEPTSDNLPTSEEGGFKTIPLDESSEVKSPSWSLRNSVASWYRCLRLLTWRSYTEATRNFGALAVRASTQIFVVVILSLVYQRLPHNQRSIQDRIGILFFITINQAFSPLVAIISVFPTEKRIVLHERLSSAYPVSAYFLGRFVAEIPALLALVGKLLYDVIPCSHHAVFFCVILYWAAGLNPLAERFFIFLAIVILDTISALALGLFVSALAPTTSIANAIGPPILLVFIIFGGFYINTKSLPYGSVWVINLSPMHWTFQALAINEFTGETFTCPVNVLGVHCEQTGEEVLARLGFAETKITTCVLGLCMLIIGFLLLGYAALILNVDSFLQLRRPPESHSVAVIDRGSPRYEHEEKDEGISQNERKVGVFLA